MSTIDTKPIGITQSYISECESIRGIAILLVVFFHASLNLSDIPGKPVDSSLPMSFIRAGDTGVTLFFVLSGFLLSLPFIKSQEVDLKKFLQNRALRILPLYWFVMITGALYYGDFILLIKTLLFWDLRIATLFPFASVAWSLATEVQFYLLLPILFLIWNAKPYRPFLWVFAILYIAIYIDVAGHWDIIRDEWYGSITMKNTIYSRWPAFLFGIILAYVHAKPGIKLKQYCHQNRLLQRGLGDLFILIILVCLGLHLQRVASLGIIEAYINFFDRFLIESFYWTAFIASILYLPIRSKALFVNPLLHSIGVIAYSLYLWHSVIMHFGAGWITPVYTSFENLSQHFQIATCIVLAIIFSAISYQLIEKPFLKLKMKKRT